jgi:2-keto-4-pentenoate hydratase/2-oxohepta-3-ene-1,7-dioic acid hydratase in catechol pathway
MGLIFPSHAVATGQKMAESPQIFMKPTTALVGHDAPIVIPKAWPDRVACGTEICAVIGRVAHRVREEDALDCVYGYTVLNDVTARGMSFPKNKIFDSFAPVGPCLVPKEFYPDPQTVSLRIRVNGREGETAHTRDMVFPVRRSVRDCAEATTLLPGDYVATGDVGSEIWLRPGDVVEAEVDVIGTLRNPCVAEAD